MAVAFANLGAMTPPVRTSCGTSTFWFDVVLFPLEPLEKLSGEGILGALLEEDIM